MAWQQMVADGGVRQPHIHTYRHTRTHSERQREEREREMKQSVCVREGKSREGKS